MSSVVTTDQAVALDWPALGTAVRLVVSEPADLEVAHELLDAELTAIDLVASRFRPDSELVRLGPGVGRPVRISPLLTAAVTAALDAAEATDGNLDPTVGVAMRDLGYDRTFTQVDRDGPAITVTRRPVPGWRRVILDRDAHTLELPAGAELDLGATAKAFVADRAARLIASLTAGRGVMVGLGGDIAVAGEAPVGGWTVRVQDVTGDVADAPVGPAQIIGLLAGGLATSSTTARRWVRGGRVMHHILDPRTGVPVVSPWRTVSVVAATCLAANIASTDAIVRGEAALDRLRRQRLPARLVDVDGLVTLLPGWPLPAGVTG